MKDLSQELLKIANKLAALGSPEEEARARAEEAKDPFMQGLRQRMDPKMKGLRERMDEHPEAKNLKTRFDELYDVEELEDAKFIVNMHTVSYAAPEDDEEDYSPEGELEDSQENVEMDYEELIDTLKNDYTELSELPLQTTRAWAIGTEQDVYTGDTVQKTIHVQSINGKKPNLEQMKAIYSAAGLIKNTRS